MKEKLDSTEQFIQKEFHNEADNIQKEVERNCDGEAVTDKITDKIRSNIDRGIDEYEREKLYSRLPEEDRKALEIGREIQKKKSRKKKRMYLSLAAALVLAMAIGVTSMGGPERVVRLIKYSLGDREVTKVNSREDVAISREEREEEAYQEAGVMFGSDVVRIVPCVDGLEFNNIELDQDIQMAEIYYKLKDEKLSYYINASYSNTSWGVDIEDSIEKEWVENINGCDIEIKEYHIAKGEMRRYSARFEYKGLEYFFYGTLDKEEFFEILNNLFFY